MCGLRGQRKEVPHVIGLLDVGIWVSFLRVNEVSKLQRIAKEEDRRVVPHEVVVTLFSVELHSKATWVAAPCPQILSPRQASRSE